MVYKHAPHVLEGRGGDAYDGHIGLPLRHLPNNRYAASRGIYVETGHQIDYINKRPNFFNADKLHHLAEDKGLISDSVGAYRAYRIPQLVRTVKDGLITFYAVGNGEKVVELLNTMRAVGKKPSCGFGMVDKWVVEDCDTDYTLFHPGARADAPGTHRRNGQYGTVGISDT